MVNTSEMAGGIIAATADWPSSAAIRGLIQEYLSQSSQKRRVVILLDVLDCLRQDMEAASGEPTELMMLMARMSDSRWRYLGESRRRSCSHTMLASDGGEASEAPRSVLDLEPGQTHALNLAPEIDDALADARCQAAAQSRRPSRSRRHAYPG